MIRLEYFPIPVSINEHGNVEFLFQLGKLALKCFGLRDGFIDFHPQAGFITLFQQTSGNAATAFEPRLHRADQGFGLIPVSFGDAVIDKNANQLNE
jgi:hypothetical protein